MQNRRSRLAIFVMLWAGFTGLVSLVMFDAITRTDEQGVTRPLFATLPPTSTEAASAPIQPVKVPFDLGIYIRETQPNVPAEVMGGYLDAARNQLRLNWVRFELRWDYIEPEAGAYNWANWDTIFEQTSQYNLQVLVSVIGSPAWARESTADMNRIGPPADYRAYADFLRVLVERYPERIQAIEIWNGMNFQDKWDTARGISAADYVDFLTFASKAIEESDSRILVVSGGLNPTGGGEGAIDNQAYMEGMIEAGLLESVDCVGVRHSGYNIGPNVPWDDVPPDNRATFRGPFDNPHHSWSFYTTVNSTARKIQAAGGNIPLCVTAFGWASAEDLGSVPPDLPFAADNTLLEQRTWLLRAIQLMESWDFVRLAMISNLNVGPEEAFNPAVGSIAYSMIRPGYAMAPAGDSIGLLNSSHHNTLNTFAE